MSAVVSVNAKLRGHCQYYRVKSRMRYACTALCNVLAVERKLHEKDTRHRRRRGGNVCCDRGGAGHEVHIYEKNERLGKKLYITGKGRCNLTNACDVEEMFDAVCTNRKFLYSAFYGCTNADVIRFF